MKEYRENNWARLIIVTVSGPMIVLFGWIILNAENMLAVILGLSMAGLFVYFAINTFAHKLLLDEEFIKETNLLRSKTIFFNDITEFQIESYFVQIKSGKTKIYISRLVLENSDEIIGSVISKLKDNKSVLCHGDPIVLQDYLNGISDTGLTENTESEIQNFTFIESTELVKTGWLFRSVNLVTPDGGFNIAYFGRGMGYECVFVNDELVSKKDSHLWYTPKFDFEFQGMNISVNVRIYPWMTIRKFWIEVGYKTVYSEG